jgi:hypothetical protein
MACSSEAIDKPISFALMRYRDYLHVLTSRWRTELIPAHLLKFWEESAQEEACKLLQVKLRPREFTFLEPVVSASLPVVFETEGHPELETGPDEWDFAETAGDILMEDLLRYKDEFDVEDAGEHSVHEDMPLVGPRASLMEHEEHTGESEAPQPHAIEAAESDDEIQVSEPHQPLLSSPDLLFLRLSLPVACLNKEPLVGTFMNQPVKRAHVFSAVSPFS